MVFQEGPGMIDAASLAVLQARDPEKLRRLLGKQSSKIALLLADVRDRDRAAADPSVVRRTPQVGADFSFQGVIPPHFTYGSWVEGQNKTS